MSEYINKSALVAEIERRIDEICNYPATESEQFIAKGASLKSLMELRTFLDTLEVKEVDLWTELGNYIEHYRNIETGYTMLGIAEHFFELGLKVQKEE